MARIRPQSRKGKTSALSVKCDTPGFAHDSFLHRKLRSAMAIIRSPLRELAIALVDDTVMSKLHRRFMNQRGPTDVMTFPLEFDRHGQVIGGEIVICLPEARRRAKIERIPLRNELLLYAIHGLLHLAGYDDRTAAGFGAMHQLEDQILVQLG